MKKIVLCIVTVFLFLGAGLPIASANTSDAVVLEGGKVVNNRTLVPIRSIFEELGAVVEWEPSTKTVRVTRGDTNISLAIGSKYTKVNGKTVMIDVPAQIINKRTFVPLRFISEAIGAKVEWRSHISSAVITLYNKTIIMVTYPNNMIAEDWYKYYPRWEFEAFVRHYTIGDGLNEPGIID